MSANAFSLLVVEDNPADSDLIREYLSEITEFETRLDCVSTLSEAKGFLQTNSVHAVLIDLSLPDSRGLNTVREVMDHLKMAPAIVLTSLDDQALALSAIESGAQDYLLKGSLNSDMLARVIRHSMQRRKWLVRLAEIQEQFYQSQKIESIGRLAGGVAHDFNNQLGTMILLSSMAIDDLPADHPSREHLEQILEVAEKSAELVRRLMIFCRQNNSQPSVIDVHEILARNEQLFGKLMGASVELQISGDKNSFIFADPGLIEQAITNLVINARDAMTSGGRLILNTTVLSDKPGTIRRVRLTIKDTGTGIPKELHEKIFEPFFTTKEVGKGTGLGLSMVHGAVIQSGGTIRVESDPGSGTEFILDFPLHLSATPAEPVVKESAARPAAFSGGQTVLLVEDEASLRSVMSQYLLRFGYKVVTASDGEEALKKIEGGAKIDLLVTDLIMPKMSGEKLCQLCRAKIPDLKVIFISGYSKEAANFQVPDRSGTTFLAKPFTANQLCDKIRALLPSSDSTNSEPS